MFLTKHANTLRIAFFFQILAKLLPQLNGTTYYSHSNFFYFRPDIQRWMEVIYHNISSCVLNNGHSLPFFQLHRGVRQGCVIGIELLARTQQNDNTIKGVNTGKKEIKLSQFADDTTVFLSDQASVPNLLHVKVLCKLTMHPAWKSTQPTQKQCGWVPGEIEQIRHITSNGRKNLSVPLEFYSLTILMQQIT